MRKFFRQIFWLGLMTVLISGCANQIKTEQLMQELTNPNYNALAQINSFITYYYLNPASERLIPSLQPILQSETLEIVSASEIKPIEHFYAAAIYNSHDQTQLLRQLTILQNKYSGRKRQLIENIVAGTQHFYSPPASSDVNFDLLWAEFFATGKAFPVKKIAGYLRMTSYQKKIEVAYLAAAEWSLAANANQHKRVLEILQQTYSSSTGIQHKRLQRILADPKKAALELDSRGELGKSGDFASFKKIVW